MKIYYFHEFIEALEAQDKAVQKQIKTKLKQLFRMPFSDFFHLGLKGKQYKGLYKLRVGDWRLIYKIEGEAMAFITLGHRAEVYK